MKFRSHRLAIFFSLIILFSLIFIVFPKKVKASCDCDDHAWWRGTTCFTDSNCDNCSISTVYPGRRGPWLVWRDIGCLEGYCWDMACVCDTAAEARAICDSSGLNDYQKSFNGVVLSPNGTRWKPGSNCAANLGNLSVSSTTGTLLNWAGTSVADYRFDYYKVYVNNANVTVTLSPPTNCGYGCGTWSVRNNINGTTLASGSGCNATFNFIPASSGWTRTVTFNLALLAPTATPTLPLCSQVGAGYMFAACSNLADEGLPSRSGCYNNACYFDIHAVVGVARDCTSPNIYCRYSHRTACGTGTCIPPAGSNPCYCATPTSIPTATKTPTPTLRLCSEIAGGHYSLCSTDSNTGTNLSGCSSNTCYTDIHVTSSRDCPVYCRYYYREACGTGTCIPPSSNECYCASATNTPTPTKTPTPTPTKTPTPVNTATPTLLPQPISVSASDGTYSDKVYIQWTKVTNADHYHVYRGTTLLTNIGQPSGATANYTDTGMVVNTKYLYKVRAVDSLFREGTEGSDIGWADSCPATGPLAPSNLTIASRYLGNGSCGEIYGSPFNILWKDNATNETKFTLYRDSSPVSDIECWSSGNCSATSGIPNTNSTNYQWPSYVNYSLTGVCGNSACHTLGVSASCNNVDGVSRESSQVTKQVCSSTGGNVTTSVSWSAGGAGPATINWTYTPPAGVYGTLFDVYRCNFSSANSVCNTCNTILASGESASPYVDNDLGISSSNRCYKVRAYTSSCPYACITATPTPTCAPECPSVPVLDGPANGEIVGISATVLTWNAVSDWGSVCSPAVQDNHYVVYISTTYDGDSDLTDEPGLVISQRIEAGTTSYNVTGLNESVTYYWQVRANNGS